MESAIRYSPYNAHLKISAIRVYGELNAAARSWELFQTMFIKHIQFESCSYLILPVLQSGALYQETISVCKEIIRLQRAAVQDAGEFSGRALENGALSKADEFIQFHLNRMNRSLTTLEAKGLILDAAPLFVQTEKQGSVGALHGIVGGATDFARAKQIIGEAHDPFATFSLLRLRGHAKEVVHHFAENRDLSVLAHELISPRRVPSAEEIVADSIRRGQLHGFLIRAALCLEAAKGPKKGKIVPASQVLRKRCSSLLAAVAQADTDCANDDGKPEQTHLMKVVLGHCRIIAAVSGGLWAESQCLEVDTLEIREEHASSLLGKILLDLKTGKELITSSGALSVGEVSRLLPEHIIPVFAVFQMCAEVFDLFGWGARKRKTKKCAAGLADVSLVMSDLIREMQAVCPSKISDSCISEFHQAVLTPGLIEASDLEETRSVISHARGVTAYRLDKVLTELKSRLDSFNVQ